MSRTDEQNFADKFDLDLHRLSELAYAHGKFGSARHDWREVARKLDAARNIVRYYMHPQDREETQ